MIRLSGRLRSALIIGVQGIRARKTRTMLSMVSLFLGVLAVVIVQAGASIAQQALLNDVELTEGVDGTLRTWVSGPATPVVLDTVRGRSDAVALTDVQVIIGEPGVSPINPGGSRFDQAAQFSGPSRYISCDQMGRCVQVDTAQGHSPPGQAIELRLTAMTGDVRAFRPFRPQSGQWLSFDSAPSLSPGIVLNLEAAKGFRQFRVPAQMRIQGATADPTPRIIGVVDDGSPQPTAYTRTDELLNWLPVNALSGPFSGGMQVLLSPDSVALQQVLLTRLKASASASASAGGRTSAGGEQQQFGFEQINSRERAATILSVLRWIFLGMAGLVLLIGVAGILNVGLATVGERVEEFALRRAVGTPRLLLAGIVLSETLLTGLLTAAAAIGVAALGVRIAGAFLATRPPFLQHVEFPWQAGLAGVVAGLVAGLLGGLIPAIRAARIPIATVMRA